MSRNIIELLAATGESYLSDPVEIERLRNCVKRANAIVAPRIEARTRAQVISMAQHPAAGRRKAPIAQRSAKKLASSGGYIQHWVNDCGDLMYDYDD